MENDMTDEAINGEVMGGELALVQINANMPEPVDFKERLEGVFAKMYADIDAELASRTVDLTTEKGRKQIASDAYKISKLKTAMAAKAGELVADQKAIFQTVTKTRQEMEAEFDKRRDLARAPLTEWEETVKVIEERAKAERSFMMTIRAQSVDGILVADMTSAQLTNLRDSRKAMEFSPDMYGDASSDLWASNVAVVDWLDGAIEAAQKSERDAAELEELRQMRAEAEAKKAAELAEIEAKEEAERQRIAAAEEAEKQAAEEAERKAKAEKEAREKAEADAAAKIKAAEDASRLAVEKAKADADAAIKKASEDQAAKEKAERDRIAAEQAETKRREADQDHRRAINRNIVSALFECGVDEDQAKAVVVAVNKGQVPSVSIKY